MAAARIQRWYVAWFPCSLLSLPLALSFACGARTGLLGPEDRAAPDTSFEDARSPDTFVTDTWRDADARDVVASIDVAEASIQVPGIDAALPPIVTPCPLGYDATAFLVAESGAFYRFDPPSASATKLGTLACPVGPVASPFAMTVTTQAAYVLYSDGQIFRVDRSTLACGATSFVDGQLGFPGNSTIATIGAAPNEEMLMYGAIQDGAGNFRPAIARASFSDFKLQLIGPLEPEPPIGFPPDIKVDAYGRLFAMDQGGKLLLVDAKDGHVLGLEPTGAPIGNALALLTWRGDVYAVTGPQGVINRYDLPTHTLHTLGAIGESIVGAGSAPCMP